MGGHCKSGRTHGSQCEAHEVFTGQAVRGLQSLLGEDRRYAWLAEDSARGDAGPSFLF